MFQWKKKKRDAEMEKELYDLETTLFARQTLDLTTKTFCSGLKESYQQGKITDKVIMNAIVMIKKKIEKAHQDQMNKTSINDMSSEDKEQDRQIPETANFPDYANDEFMTKKIHFILSLYDNEFITNSHDL